MKNSRNWVLLGFGVLIVIGAALILQPFLNPPQLIPPPTLPPLTVPPPGAVPDPDVTRITPGNARAAHVLQQAVFVDVRDKDAYQRGHIPGALSIPLSELENQLGELDKEQWIIAYCT